MTFLFQVALALLFYFIFFLFGAIGLPFSSRLFTKPQLAFATAKLLGLVLFGYFIWLLGSLKILDYQNKTAILTLFIIAIVAGLYFSKTILYQLFNNPAPVKKHSPKERPLYKKILIIEGLTLLIYLAYLWLRAHNSDINGTERFMDMALLTASGKTHYFPFIDSWYSGKTVNYYYFGAYLMSLISNLSRIPYEISYNLALGLIYCQSVILTGAITFAISNSKKFAVAAAFLATTAGTWFFAGCTLHAVFAQVPTVCSYTSSTRLYTPSYIINEIPSYSFTVGDLHAHLLALPFFLLCLALIYTFLNFLKPRFSWLPILSFSLAVSGMINAWDLVTLSSVLGVGVIIKYFIEVKKTKSYKTTASWLGFGISAIILALVLMYPALRNFQSPVLGIGFIPSYIALHNLKDVQYPTPLLAEVGMWGTFIAGIILFIYFKRKQLSEYIFPILLGIVSLGVILGVELVFVKDIYSVANPPYFRANTTFKFGYHAWVMLSIAFCIFMAELSIKKPNDKKTPVTFIAKFIFALALIGGIFYPYSAINEFYLSSTSTITLDGSSWMQKDLPTDLQTIKYINQNIKERSVIAEAVGDSYTTYSRIATYTGNITPMGWQTHEWTWRFNGKLAEKAPIGQAVETGWGAISTVAGDIRNLYTTKNINDAKQIIEKYKIQYIYIGSLEYKAYPQLDEPKFHQLGHIVFQDQISELFAVNSF